MPMRPDVFVYLSGPITATPTRTTEQHVADAVGVYWELIRRGIPAFCPHLGGAFPSAYLIPHDVWLDYDCAVIDRCTHVLMLPGWPVSKGAIRERDYARTLGKVIVDNIADLEQTL